jgi:hypothetical protein
MHAQASIHATLTQRLVVSSPRPTPRGCGRATRNPRHGPSPRRLKIKAQVGFDVVSAVDADTFRNGFFATCGFTVVGFVATFFVLPQYADRVKESQPWKAVFLSLQASGLPTIPPQEVQAAQQADGYVILVSAAGVVSRVEKAG